MATLHKGREFYVSISMYETTICVYDLPDDTKTKVQKLFLTSEKTLTRFNENSELSQLNRSINKPFICSPILFEAVKIADQFFHKTEGIYNPYLGKKLNALGYNCSFETIDKVSFQMKNPDPFSFHHPLTINDGMKCITINHDINIDLGGIAKGWTAQCIADLLQKDGNEHGVLVAGGDITAWGTSKQTKLISIDHPRYENQALCTFVLIKDSGIATSSVIKRQWYSQDYDSLHHIIDPRTSMPSTSELIQTTIIAPTLTEAEVLTKCLLILGWDKGVELLHSYHQPFVAIGLTVNESLLLAGEIDYFTKEGVNLYEHLSS